MQIRKITIPYSGREKYPSNGTGESVRTMITSYMSGMMGGSSGPGGNVTPGDENRGGNATSFFCFLSKTNGTYSEVDLAQSAITDNIQVMGYKNQDVAQTFVGDISESASTNFAISGLASGMSVTVSGNGTTAATIMLTVNSTVSGNSGTLSIPIAVNINDNDLDPYQYVWNENTNKCMQMTLSFTWAINRAVSGNYVLDLSNQTAQVNCDSAGTLYPNSIATLQCTAETYYNGSEASGITYSAYTDFFYGATGFSINQDSGVLSFNSAGTKFFWSTNYPSLPINIVAKKDGTPIATKTMTVSRNYPGTDGTPAHTRYIVTDYDVVKYNPNTSAFTPTQVVGTVMLQVGDQLPVYDSATTIYLWYDGLNPATASTSAVGETTANTYDGISSMSFGLKNADDVFYEIEEVPVISEGVDGEPGQPGQPGASGASGESAWYLTLSNDNASINCDSNGNILPGAVRPTCQGKLYQGNSRKTDATYTVDWGTASGITSAVSSGILTLTFGSGFDFTGTTLSISISGKSGDEVKDVKIMNVTKAYAGEAGESGESAVSYWLEPSFGEVIYDPNTKSFTPETILVAGFKQIGQGAVLPAADATIYYSYGYGLSFTPQSAYTGPLTITSALCEDYQRIRLVMKVGVNQVDQEDIDILKNGISGQTGAQGRSGAAVRGPYYWNEHSASTRCWCAGESGGSCTECEKWIDVIYKDGTYYYCSTTYYGSLSPWDSVKSNWTSGTSFDFIATRLLLAQNASIDFLVGNEFYLRDTNGNITGGGAGGSGITFWAGAENPSDAPFWVDAQGNIFANKGTFAGYIQYPYTFVSQLTYSSSTSTYYADGRAYLISDIYNEGLYDPVKFVLPAPSSGLNGFSYDIIVEPAISQAEGVQMLDMKAADSSDIYCYAYAELRKSDNFVLTGGRYVITCIPKRDGITTSYNWAITQATGGLEVVESNRTEYVSNLLATSYDTTTSNLVNRVLTYQDTKPSVPNPGNTMYVKL